MLSLEALIERLRSLFKEEALRVDAANSGIATETTLSSINSKIIKADTDNVTIVSEPAYDPTNDLKKVSIENDIVGLAKDSTLNSILGQLDITLSSLRDDLKSSLDSKIPSPQPLSDSLSNMTTNIFGSALLGFDGTNWRRVRVTTDGKLQLWLG